MKLGLASVDSGGGSVIVLVVVPVKEIGALFWVAAGGPGDEAWPVGLAEVPFGVPLVFMATFELDFTAVLVAVLTAVEV
jgi:hypothetical protein